MRRRALIGVMAGLITLGVRAGVAGADGLPVVGFEGGAAQVASIDGRVTYVARPSRRATRVSRFAANGHPRGTVDIPGRFVVPVVAYDGSPGGLSADGRTLVLIRPRAAFPQRSTTIAIVAAAALRLRSLVRLRGDFSFDAIAPSGRWIYLIQYTSASDPTAYRVRALDARSGRLLSQPIVDPHDRGEAMRGRPMTRAMSADGRWAYTLYDGNGHPFVHALDTTSRTARCLDLPASAANSVQYGARLSFADHRARLLVTAGRGVLAVIDTRTLTVSAPSHTPLARTAGRAAEDSSSPVLPALAVAAAAVLLSAGGLAGHRRWRGSTLHAP